MHGACEMLLRPVLPSAEGEMWKALRLCLGPWMLQTVSVLSHVGTPVGGWLYGAWFCQAGHGLLGLQQAYK